MNKSHSYVPYDTESSVLFSIDHIPDIQKKAEQNDPVFVLVRFSVQSNLFFKLVFKQVPVDAPS